MINCMRTNNHTSVIFYINVTSCSVAWKMIWSAPLNIIASFFSYCLWHIPLFFSCHSMFLCHLYGTTSVESYDYILNIGCGEIEAALAHWTVLFISHLFFSSFLTKAYCFSSFLALCWSNWNDYPTSVKYFCS